MRFGWFSALLAIAACSGPGGNGPGGGGPDAGSGNGAIDAAFHDGPRSIDAPVDAPANLTAHQYCVQVTNHYRTTVPPPGTGAPRAPVAESAQLEAYADTGAMYDFTNGPHAHFIATSGGGIAFAENECPHWNLAQTGGDMNMLVGACIAAFYSEGPGGGHYDNMMGAYATLGCGIYNQSGDVTIVQDYGY